MARNSISLVLAAALMAASVPACQQASPESVSRSTATWQYPIRLGDTRARVNEFLTMPAIDDGGIHQEYPASGVAIFFDDTGHLAKISIYGPASKVIGMRIGGSEILPSNRPVVFGLAGTVNEATFRKVLGRPETETRGPRERRCVWNKDGYVIDAQFLAIQREDERGTLYSPGTLLWFDITRGL
jgi:hypothetical protein